MKELIPVQQKEISGHMIKTVNAREIHQFLEVKKDFSDWMKMQVDRARLKEGRDFIVIPQKGENLKGGRPALDYHLTLDAAKHVAMMSGTDKGFEVRDYFIDCERVALQQPSTLQLPDFTNPVAAARAWADAKEGEQKALAQGEAARRQIEQDRPKVEFAETVTEIKDGIDMGTFAKLTYDKFKIGRNRLFDWLRDQRILHRDNIPNQRYLENGWFAIKAGHYHNKKHDTMVPYTKTQVTGKGQLGLFKLLSEKLNKEVSSAV
jgi:anti-repressor protein